MWPWKSKTPLDLARDKLEDMNRNGELAAFLDSLPSWYPKLDKDASEEEGNRAIAHIFRKAALESAFCCDLLMQLGLPTMEEFTATTGIQSRNINRWILFIALATLIVASIGVYLAYHQEQARRPVSSPTTQAADPPATRSAR